jgi:hypothetical protein
MSKNFEERLKAALARREAKERASESELEDRNIHPIRHPPSLDFRRSPAR